MHAFNPPIAAIMLPNSTHNIFTSAIINCHNMPAKTTTSQNQLPMLFSGL